MTEQEVVRQVRRHRPGSVDELLERCGVGLQFIGDGAYRKVYCIGTLPLVVKLPKRGGALEANAREHASVEFHAYRRIMRSKTRYAHLRRFMPEVLYFSRLNGTTLMRKYEEVPWTRAYRRAMNDLSKVVESAFPATYDADLGEGKWDNYGLDRDGTLKIIDLGLLLPVTNGNK